MTVLNAGVETYAVVAKSCLKGLYKFVGFFRSNVSGRMILNAVFCNADDVATQCEFARLKFHSDARSFERTATFIHLFQIVTKHRHICHLATRMESRCHGHQAPSAPLACQLVHKRSIRRLQKGLSVESFNRPTCHTIAKNNYVLHRSEYFNAFGKTNKREEEGERQSRIPLSLNHEYSHQRDDEIVDATRKVHLARIYGA